VADHAIVGGDGGDDVLVPLEKKHLKDNHFPFVNQRKEVPVNGGVVHFLVGHFKSHTFLGSEIQQWRGTAPRIDTRRS
jgi:hypothetical protein